MHLLPALVGNHSLVRSREYFTNCETGSNTIMLCAAIFSHCSIERLAPVRGGGGGGGKEGGGGGREGEGREGGAVFV